MPPNPYQPPREVNEPATIRRTLLRPLIAPFIGAAIGFSGGALYAIGYFLVHFLGVLSPEKFLGETLEAVIALGAYFGIIGAGIGLLLAAILWLPGVVKNR